jgi:hypothetical protein
MQPERSFFPIENSWIDIADKKYNKCLTGLNPNGFREGLNDDLLQARYRLRLAIWRSSL